MANVFEDQKVREILEKDVLGLIGGQDLPQEKKEELYLKMADTIKNRVIARIDDQLSDSERQEWGNLADIGDKIKMEEYLDSKNIDVPKLVAEEAIIYKTQIALLAKPENKE